MDPHPTATPGEIVLPKHGTWEGHVLPGTFFIVWSSWWIIGIIRLHCKTTAKKTYKSRSWFEFPKSGSKYPIEPYLKVLLTFIGINAELWAGHVSYRVLFDPSTGGFMEGNIQDWQHSAMYAGFLASGVVDLIGFYAPPGTLPPGIEQVFLGIAFMNEGLLFGFHLKGTQLDKTVHVLLVMTIFAASLCTFMEVWQPHSLLLSTARAQLVLLQGVWFWQIAGILFNGNVAWDPNTHGAVMMVPLVFVVWVLITAMGILIVFTVVNLYRLQKLKHSSGHREEEEGALLNGRSTHTELELPNSSHSS